MATHVDILAQEAGRQAGQIGSLAQAANCVMGGGQPGDPLVRLTIVQDILDVIEGLAGLAERAAETIERAAERGIKI